eukprot:2253465-Pleurochrysis_carterae.AAC.1
MRTERGLVRVGVEVKGVRAVLAGELVGNCDLRVAQFRDCRRCHHLDELDRFTSIRVIAFVAGRAPQQAPSRILQSCACHRASAPTCEGRG